MDVISQINNALMPTTGGTLLELVLALAAIGTIAMLVIQIIKELTPMRRSYQMQKVKEWLEEKSRTSTMDIKKANAGKPYAQLVDLATGRDEKALFELPTEQMVAQMNAAAQAAMDYPKDHQDLLIALSSGASREDVTLVINGGAAEAAANDARVRVSNRIQRNLDALQIVVSADWKWQMQVASIILTVGIVELAIWASHADLQAHLLGVLIGIAGAYFAPITRDIVAAVQSLRR
jgi:hypothetical protein